MSVSVLLMAVAVVWRAVLSRELHYNRCPDSCSSCANFLHCYRNNWTDLPASLSELAAQVSTSRVVIKNTRLTRLGTGFANVSSLVELNLSRNHLKTIKKDAFVGLRRLRVLDLSANSLRSLEDGLFQDLISLEQLLLQGNLLTRLFQLQFSKLGSLTTLDLGSNFVEFIELEAFGGLGKLRDLSLQSNGLHYVDRRWFDGLNSLDSLSLSYNPMVELHDFVFTYLQNLTVLELKNCGTATVGTSTFDGLHNVRTLLLSENSFSSFPVLSSSVLPRLSYLTIGGSFSKIPQNSLVDFPQLKVLAVEKCRHLTMIEQASFIRLPSLEKLHVRHNKHLRKINPGAFSEVMTPGDVDLRDNRLRSLSQGLFNWKDVGRIILEDNDWHCSCSLKWVTDLGLEGLVCSSPEPVAGLFLDQVDNLTCEDEEELKLHEQQEGGMTDVPLTVVPTDPYKTDWGLTPYQIGLIVGVSLVLVATLIVTTLVLREGTPGANTSRGRRQPRWDNDDEKGHNS